ncbi:hypothetical protein Q3G72_014074 [Acer saccharum]|nr:hypothetical protein Q3G72_014074 [Acer saccharum]
MSSNMQRQAVPLSRSEKCIVGTGLERQVALDSGVTAIAEHEGKVLYTDIDKIILSGNGDTIAKAIRNPGHPWGNAPGAVANRVALEACVQARNEGRDLAREGNEIIRDASKWSAELAATCEVWKEIKFEFEAMGKDPQNIG